MRRIDLIMREYNIDRNFFERNDIPVVYDGFLRAKTYRFLVEQSLEKIEKDKPCITHIMMTRKKRRRGEY